MKPLRARVLFLLPLILILAACTSGTPQAAVTKPAVTATKTRVPASPTGAVSSLQASDEALHDLTIELWHPWFQGVEASLLESMVSDFNQKNQWGIQVALTGQINYSYLYENVTTALPTPRRPDLVIALPEQARAWSGDGYVADLTPYLNDPVYGWDADQRQDFPSAFLAQDTAGAARLGLPAQRTARFLLWNKTWAGELGFDSPPRTPEDFHLQSCRAHQAMLADATPDNDGLGGWIIDSDSMTAFSWLLAFEGGVLEGQDYRFLTPNNITAFKFVKNLQEEGCAWQEPPGQDATEAFAARGGLFATAGLEQFPDQVRAFSAAGNSDEWVPLPFPGKDQDALVIYGSSFVMLDSTDEEQLASWLFIRWMLEGENDARWAKATGLFPLRGSSMNLLGSYADSHPQWAAAVELIPQGQLQPQLASWRTVKVMLGDGFDCMFRGTPQCLQAPVILSQMEAISHDRSE
jgi:ABC-type glycerol-3-phosphate transport system substrate-binding protein